MANATFGVNIIPKSNTVTIGNSDAPWKIVSPELTGVPTAPTAAAGSNTTQVATTAFVKSALPDVMTGATSLADGTSGLVPAPETTDVNKFLRSDGTWADAGSVLTKIPFSFAVSDWVSTAGAYEASVVNANFITTSEEFVLYDSSIEHLRSGLSAEKDTASTAMVFTTGTLPTGVISGNIYSINKNNGQIAVTFIDSVVPISRGGTGATTASAARTNLGIVSLPTVSSSDNGKVMTVVNGEWSAAAGVSPSSYESLGNKPSINSVTLSGNKTSSDLGLASQASLDLKVDKANIENDLTETAAGYVLDARQGKVLDDKVSDLRSAISSLDAEINGEVTPPTPVQVNNLNIQNNGAAYETSGNHDTLYIPVTSGVVYTLNVTASDSAKFSRLAYCENIPASSVSATFIENKTGSYNYEYTTLVNGYFSISYWKNDIANVTVSISGQDGLVTQVAEIQQTLNNKITEPSSDGTSGQVLTTDGNGGRRWTTVQGGGSGATIDDTAGAGDTDKVWSANKLASEFAGKADKVSSATNGNFAALDSNGNLTDSGHKHSDYLTSHQDISGKQDKTDSSLTTTAQTIVGAINENNTAITKLNPSALTSSQTIKAVAANNTYCPVPSVRWFDMQNAVTSDLPYASMKYSEARVIRRTASVATIDLYADNGRHHFVCSTQDGGSTWGDWNEIALKSDANYKTGDTITFYRYCLLAQSPSNGSANGYILMPKKMDSGLTISESSVSVLMQDTTGNSITATATFARYSDEFLKVTLSATSGISSSAFYFVRLNATLTFS